MLELMAYMVVGLICRRTGLLQEKVVNWLTSLVVYFLLPMLVFNSLYQSFSLALLRQSGVFLLFLVVGTALSCLAAWGTGRLLKMGGDRLGPLVFSALFCSAGFITLPLVQTVFSGEGALFRDESAVLYASLAVILVNLFLGCSGQMLIERFAKGKIEGGFAARKMILNPAVLAFVLGLVLAVSGLRLPPVVETGAVWVGKATAPIAMLVLGAMLAGCKAKEIFLDRKMYLICAVRLLVVPLAIFALANLFTNNHTLTLTLAIVIGTPVASVLPACALRGGADAKWSANYTFISTVLSAVTLPLIVMASSLAR